MFRAAAANKKLPHFFMTVLATVFLTAAVAASLANLFGANNTWVYFTAGVLTVSGLFILLARGEAQ
jgi:membrane protein YdbS with pleckstrin-like domain